MSPSDLAAVEAVTFVDKLNQLVLFPIIALLSAVAFLVFIWGCVQYVTASSNATAREQGVKHITYGIIGLVVMISAFAILSIAASTFGLDNELECADANTGPCSAIFTPSP